MPIITPDPFAPAVREAVKAKAGLVGVAGSGKTFSSLAALTVLADGGPVAYIDTERRTSLLYADEFQFSAMHMPGFTEAWNPLEYIDKLLGAAQAAEAHGYAALGIDSFSHMWDAVLRFVDLHNRGGLSGWIEGTPLQQRIVDTIMGLDLHVIVTMRAKTEWVHSEVTKKGRDGKERTVIEPTKVGMGSRQREGVDYEFQLIGNVDLITHTMTVEKTRARLFADAIVPPSRTEEFWVGFRDWLATGADLASGRQIAQIRDLVAEVPGPPGKPMRDWLRAALVAADAESIEQITKGEATAVITELADRVELLRARPDDDPPISNGFDGAVEAGEPPHAPDTYGPSPVGDPPHVLGDDDHRADAYPIIDAYGHEDLDPRDLDTPVDTDYLWLPDAAVARFLMALAVVGKWVGPAAIPEKVLVLAGTTSYDPSWITAGATEQMLIDAASLVLDAMAGDVAYYPGQPGPRELVAEAAATGLWRPSPADEAGPPPDPEPEGGSVHVDPRRRRTGEYDPDRAGARR